ncbi:hypothetical protein WJX75_003198 [Coccomyxa subellipsoidea]|uniref:Transcription factor TFIIIC triple barrel domain-containing protein n=1 Tax=Coccomyxa subellipsoidea TaxID=248742 RepID=A0ABR2YCV3_9CHLO
MDWDGLAYCTDLPLLADAQAAHTSETTSTNKADTGSAVRAIERIKNTGDQLFLEYAPDTKEAKQDKSALDSQFVVVATKLKTEGHYSGSAATLVYGDCLEYAGRVYTVGYHLIRSYPVNAPSSSKPGVRGG